MDLQSGYPFWPIRNGLMHVFPPLEDDVRCDVLVVGAGITAALVARELANAGLDVVVVDERDIAWGSTAASTALLQYEIDTHLVDLGKRYGSEAGVLTYLQCRDAMYDLEAICAEIGDVDFAAADSLYLASSRRDSPSVRHEFEARRQAGLSVNWLSPRELAEKYAVTAYGAILSRPAGRVDPYRFTSRLLALLHVRGVRVFDRTRVESWTTTERGAIAITRHGAKVRARYVVIAAGYAAQEYLRRKIAKNRSTYAWISDVQKPQSLGIWASTLLWESARPYVYLRPTSDHRIIVGGEDDRIDLPSRRDRRLPNKVRKLQRRVANLLPAVVLEPAFAWGGTFAETADGLPYFGPEPGASPRILYALAYGGNGITYAVIGARLLTERILRKPLSPIGDLFSFRRTER